MLKRSRDWLVLAVLPGCFAFSGWVQAWATPALVVFWTCIGFCVFSLLLSLFEASADPMPPLPHSAPQASHWPVRRWTQLMHRHS